LVATLAPRKSPWTDAAVLLAHAVGWTALALAGALVAWPAFVLALLATGSALGVCKGLSWAPRWRPVAALAPVLAAAAAPFAQEAEVEGAWYAVVAATATTAGYALFSALRRGWLAWAYRRPDGRADGFDYGRWYRWSEHLRGRLRRRAWRIAFPRTDKEAALRGGDWRARDRIDFGALDADALGTHDLVVPLSAHDLAALEPLRARFAGHPIALPSRDCIALCEDKPRFNARLVERGFGAHVPSMQPPFAFPYIVKKRHAEWGEHSHVVASVDDEHRYTAQLADPDYFRQAFVPGATEFTTHVLVRDGRLVRALTLEFTFAHALPVKSRDCQAIAIRLRRTTQRGLFEAMLRAIGFEGLGCFNYKLVDGQPQVFEFNPRFGASLAPFFPTFLRSLPKPGG